MKKIFCLFALTMFACAFVACNNSVEEATEYSIVEETVDTVVDTVVIDTIA